MPTSITSTPADCKPSASAADSDGPLSRPSRPMTTVFSPLMSAALPNAWPICRAIRMSSVLPSTPRMSYALKMPGVRLALLFAIVVRSVVSVNSVYSVDLVYSDRLQEVRCLSRNTRQTDCERLVPYWQRSEILLE